MTTGLVIGKFYPPHLGHHHVIDTALKECDQVVVLVLWSEVESIPGFLRASWLREIHPKALVVDQQDEHPVDLNSEETWAAHVSCMRKALDKAWTRGRGHTLWNIDHVYGSEEYIPELARRFGAEPRIVDLDRERFPISATEIRAHTAQHWSYLHPVVKAVLCKRVICIGAESCGTTTLAKHLATAYGTNWVPEYGRLYSEGLVRRMDWEHDDFKHIAEVQSALESRMAKRSKFGVVVADTNVLATQVWEEFLTREPSDLKPGIADLYILTDFCLWEDDGTRFFPDRRFEMQDRFRQLLEQQNVPWIEVTGNRRERLSQAWDAMMDIRTWDMAPPL